jgi:hypothetical protein
MRLALAIRKYVNEIDMAQDEVSGGGYFFNAVMGYGREYICHLFKILKHDVHLNTVK